MGSRPATSFSPLAVSRPVGVLVAPTGTALRPPPITLANVENAARTIRGQIDDSPFLLSETLPEIARCEVWLKFENIQSTAVSNSAARSTNCFG